MDFVAFPSVPYLIAPVDVEVRIDKVLSERQASTMLAREIDVEEKIDGENLGISYDGDSLRFQARSSYVQPGGRHFRGLEAWIRPRQTRLLATIGTDLVLFGEWCASAHSVSYNALPDWFLLFDIYDRSSGCFWDSTRRNELANEIGLHTVPRLDVGRFTMEQLLGMIGPSRVGQDQMEGIVIRSQSFGWTESRAKAVRAGFMQQIDQHWMAQPRKANRLSSSWSP